MDHAEQARAQQARRNAARQNLKLVKSRGRNRSAAGHGSLGMSLDEVGRELAD